MTKCQKIIDEVPFVREAVQLSKWAFASDYIRLYAIFSEGGIYLDSDVFVYQNFDPFLENRYFTNIEFTSHFKKNKSWKFLNEDGTKKDPNQIALPGLALQAAIFGAEAGHPFLRKCMEYYDDFYDGLKDNRNILEAYDMTTEAAVAKLYHLFSLGVSKEEIKQLMEKNIAGELTE